MDEYERIKRNRTMNGWLRSLVAVLTSVALACGVIFVVEGTAQAAAPDRYRMATWNMRYGPDKWDRAFNLAQFTDVVALQEVPEYLPHDLWTNRGEDQRTIRNSRGTTLAGTDIRFWRWERDGGVYYLYVLRTESRHLGLITPLQPNNVIQIDSVNRPALGLINRADDILFASMHAESEHGNDAGALVRRVEAAAHDQRLNHWVALGDFNREPGNAANQLEALNLPGHHVYNSGQATHESGRELDYAVGNVTTDRWAAEVHPNRAQTTTSDHWPVVFGGLRAAAAQAQPPRNKSTNAGQRKPGKWFMDVNSGEHRELRKRNGTAAGTEAEPQKP